jgi:uncharacterized membrane protein YraQ (UPF0718 family)
MARRPRVLDATLLLLVLGLLLLVALAWWRGGGELVWQGLAGGGGLLLRYALVIAISFLAAGFAEVLIPHAWVNQYLGADSGLRGILLGSAAGVVTPAGPFVSMPVAAVMLRAGAGPGPVVAFLTGWSLLALHRLVAWEVPILGLRFALLRYLACLALPLLAGLLARALFR